MVHGTYDFIFRKIHNAVYVKIGVKSALLC